MDIIGDGVLWNHIVSQIKEKVFVKRGAAQYDLWSDGDKILVSDGNAAEIIADFLSAIGFDATTGYYDPTEDLLGNTVDEYTGYHYIDIS